MDLDINLFGALVAGLLSFASPCVLPLVPPYLCFLAGTSINELSDENMPAAAWRKVVMSAIAFVAGFATVFVAMGASASFLGSFITRHLDTLSIVAGVIIIILGLHFLGVFRIGLLYRDIRLEGPKKSVGLFGAYLVGLAFAFGWTPCVGPVLAAILFLAGQEANVLRGAMLLLAYALGIGIPFILAAVFFRPFMDAMKRFRKHMGLVEKVTGGLLVLTGILFITGAMSWLAYYMLELFPGLGTIG
ncbi:MAG: cytochrome c biogenesis protein CcdA [Anderseniella sp.]|nr:cytochrome c biogenesis protein CcdA [Anderseniella sp.]